MGDTQISSSSCTNKMEKMTGTKPGPPEGMASRLVSTGTEVSASSSSSAPTTSSTPDWGESAPGHESSTGFSPPKNAPRRVSQNKPVVLTAKVVSVRQTSTVSDVSSGHADSNEKVRFREVSSDLFFLTFLHELLRYALRLQWVPYY